jgi:antibiotic biosynthesis monooxygenase (ABM) superfamily enzyme
VFDVGLQMGEFAWLHIAQRLTQGNSLQDAVQTANGDIDGAAPWFDANGNPVAPVHWKVVGDGTIKFY